MNCHAERSEVSPRHSIQTLRFAQGDKQGPASQAFRRAQGNTATLSC